MDFPTYQQQIDIIMDNFDFGKVAKAMKALGWRWHGCDGVPEEPELRKEARRLLREVADAEDFTGVSTGGFVAECHHYDEGKGLSLRFQIDDWDGATEYFDTRQDIRAVSCEKETA